MLRNGSEYTRDQKGAAYTSEGCQPLASETIWGAARNGTKRNDGENRGDHKIEDRGEPRHDFIRLRVALNVAGGGFTNLFLHFVFTNRAFGPAV